MSVRRSGSGEPIVLLDGFPHTKELWRNVEPLLIAGGHQVIAPDLRGLGDSERARTGFEAQNQAKDQVRLLDALAVDAAHVVGFDVGAAVAFALATQHSDRVRSLTIMEAIVGGLPGAEEFFRAGGPWWFGFHQAPGGLAEDIVAGSEDRYIRYFLESRARTHLPDDLAKRFIQAYTGRDSLRAAFEHYRAMPSNAETNSSWAEHGRLNLPVAAVTSTGWSAGAPTGSVRRRPRGAPAAGQWARRAARRAAGSRRDSAGDGCTRRVTGSRRTPRECSAARARIHRTGCLSFPSGRAHCRRLISAEAC